jgi:hypothetical protein
MFQEAVKEIHRDEESAGATVTQRVSYTRAYLDALLEEIDDEDRFTPLAFKILMDPSAE